MAMEFLFLLLQQARQYLFTNLESLDAVKDEANGFDRLQRGSYALSETFSISSKIL